MAADPLRESQSVIVTDIHMPFGSMVAFMVKWAIASIPAIIILSIVGLVISAVFYGVIGGIFGTGRW